ncbi:MAG: M20/M25/M40 family metallo-hydrolase, partial [Pseudomonadota bacterium]
HRLMAWGMALKNGIATAKRGDPLHDLRLNIGLIEGGQKPNMIAASAVAAFNLRTPPGSHAQAIVDAVTALAPEAHVTSLTPSFVAPSLPAAGQATHDKHAWIERLGVTPSDPVDFWTEAALFDAAGLPAIVLGSGDIAQAHTADEWVALDQLDELHRIYAGWIGDGRA